MRWARCVRSGDERKVEIWKASVLSEKVEISWLLLISRDNVRSKHNDFCTTSTVQRALCSSCSSPSNFVVWSRRAYHTLSVRSLFSCNFVWAERSADRILFMSVVIVKDVNCEINSIYLICSFSGDCVERFTWNVWVGIYELLKDGVVWRCRLIKRNM